MTDARMAALEALEADVREWTKPSGQGADNGFWLRRVHERLAALDALPAPAQGETVEVWGVVLASGDGGWTLFGSDLCDDADDAEKRARKAVLTVNERRTAIITARVPLLTIPTIRATVEGGGE